MKKTMTILTAAAFAAGAVAVTSVTATGAQSAVAPPARVQAVSFAVGI